MSSSRIHGAEVSPHRCSPAQGHLAQLSGLPSLQILWGVARCQQFPLPRSVFRVLTHRAMWSTSRCDAGYKSARCTVQVEPMRSTSWATHDQRQNCHLLPADIFRYAAAVRSARFRCHRFGIYTCIFNAHVFLMSKPATPTRTVVTIRATAEATHTYHAPHCSNIRLVGAAELRATPEFTRRREERHYG